MGKLDGKVAFITGVARGQGRSHAIRLAEEGADIIGVDLCGPVESVAYALATRDDLDETARLVEKVGGRIIATQADVRDEGRLRTAVDQGVREFGRLDIVLANAGVAPVIGPVASEMAAWHDAIDIMLTGVYLTIRTTIGHIRAGGRGGSIVITSSTAGLKGMADETAGYNAYVAAKWGVVGLMKSTANVYASEFIRCNSVHPTGTRTPMVENPEFTQHCIDHPEIPEGFRNPIPVDLVEPEDISNAVLYLVSDLGRYVTGQTLAVDAGLTNRV